VAGVPEYANVVGADETPDGRIVITFDVPVAVAGVEYLPGELLAWNGTALSSFSFDPAWPPGMQMRDFSLTLPVGAIPDGAFVSGVPLTVSQAAGGNLTLAWGAACAGPAIDFEIYEGTIGSYYSHEALFCTTNSQTSATFTPSAGSRYYLVVPRTAQREGSYGQDSQGFERPAGDGSCAIQQVLACP